MKKKILALLAVVILCPLYAQYPIVRNFTRTDYMAGKQNWCIEQDQDNKMYFANNSGLLEYDSELWQLHPIANYTNVRSLLYDPDTRRLYAGAFNELGYYCHEEASHKLVYHSLLDRIPEEERNFSEIWNICKNGKELFFQSDRKVLVFDENGHVNIYTFGNKLDYSTIIHNTFVAASTQDGIWTLVHGLLVKLPDSDVLIDKKVTAILPYEETKILFVTALDGLYLFDGGKIVPFDNGLNDFLKENQVFCATVKGRKIAFGTVLKGAVVTDMETGENTFVNTYSGLQNNTVLGIRFDNDNNLWLGLDKGISYVLINSPVKNLFSASIPYGSGYASLIKGDVLYLGTNQGLYTTAYPLKNAPDPIRIDLVPHMQSQVWCLKEIDNTIFCGNDLGAFVVEGGVPRKLLGTGTWNFRQLKKRPDCILACSYSGFCILKKSDGRWGFSNYVAGFSESGGMFEEDADGNIWFGHWMKGIYRLTMDEKMERFLDIRLYDYTKGLPSNHNNVINYVNGHLYASTQEGFFQFDEKTDGFVFSPGMDSFFVPHNKSVHLYEGPEQNCWCASATSVAFISHQGNGHYQLDSLSYKSLLDKLNIGFEHFNFIRKDMVLVGIEDGFACIDMGKRNVADRTSRIFVRNVYSINRKDSLLYSRSGEDGQVILPPVPYKLNSLRFEFVLPEYQDKQAVEYSYFLENYDTQWSEGANKNYKEYTGLRKGEYVFRVRGYNKLSGLTSESSVAFTILPPWYANNVAYVLYVLLATGFVYVGMLGINKRTQRVANRVKAEKERQLKEQKEHFLAETREKEREIIELKRQQLEYDLKHKSQELASSTMNLIRKNEILTDISNDISVLTEEIKKNEGVTVTYKKLQLIVDNIQENITHDSDWERFEQSFDLAHDNYLKRLSKQFSSLNVNDKKLCAYLKMNLSSKDIAPLLNMSVRSVETARYRLRKKLGLDQGENLTEFLQRF